MVRSVSRGSSRNPPPTKKPVAKAPQQPQPQPPQPQQPQPQQPQPQQKPAEKNSLADKLDKAANFVPKAISDKAQSLGLASTTTSDTGTSTPSAGVQPTIPNLVLAGATASPAGFGAVGAAAKAPEAAQAAEKALPEGKFIQPVDQYKEIIKTQASKLGKITLKNTGEEYKTARAALKAGDVVGFAKNVKSVAFSRQMIDAAFLNSKGNVSAGKLIGASVGAAAVVGSMIGTYPWASWSRTEAQEIMSMAVEDAMRKNDPQLLEEALAKQQAIIDRNAWEKIAEKIPFANIAEGFMEKFDALEFQAKVSATVVKDLNSASGGSSGGWDAQAWLDAKEQADKNEIETQKTISENWNESRKDIVRWEREAAVKGRNEDAAFWRRYKEQTYQREREERQAAADFWFEYRKKLKQFEEDTAPSSLSFGLLQ